MIRRISKLLFFAVGLVMFGCGGGNDLPTVPVSGKVTFAGEAPPARGSIRFIPHAGTGSSTSPGRPGSGQFETDGEFVVTSFAAGDGLLPGTYGVSITCLKKGELDFSNPDPAAMAAQDYVPPDYRPEDLVVKEGQEAIEVNFDVPRKN